MTEPIKTGVAIRPECELCGDTKKCPDCKGKGLAYTEDRRTPINCPTCQGLGPWGLLIVELNSQTKTQ